MSITMTRDNRDEIEALPPAPTAVYRALEQADTPMTRRELVEETIQKPRTVRDAVERLVDEGLVERAWSCDDARRRTYQTTEDCR